MFTRGLNWVETSYALLCINLILILVTTNGWLKHLKLALWEIITVKRTKGTSRQSQITNS